VALPLPLTSGTDTTLLYLYMSRSSAGKRLKLVKLIEETANSYGIMSLNSPIGDCRGAQGEVCVMCRCVQHRLVTWTSVDVFCQQSHCLLRGSTARLRCLHVTLCFFISNTVTQQQLCYFIQWLKFANIKFHQKAHVVAVNMLYVLCCYCLHVRCYIYLVKFSFIIESAT